MADRKEQSKFFIRKEKGRNSKNVRGDLKIAVIYSPGGCFLLVPWKWQEKETFSHLGQGIITKPAARDMMRIGALGKALEGEWRGPELPSLGRLRDLEPESLGEVWVN